MTTVQLATPPRETPVATMHAFVTHRFTLDDILKAYDTFGNAAKHGALKVVMKTG